MSTLPTAPTGSGCSSRAPLRAPVQRDRPTPTGRTPELPASDGSATNISVCVCSRNRARSLHQTLEALHAAIPRDADDVEVLVVDNASVDETAGVIAEAASRDSRVRHLFEPYPGVSRARNTAIRHAQGTIIVCIDDDVRPQPGWLEAITAPIAAGIADAVAGRIILPDELMRPWMTEFFRVRFAESMPRRESPPPLISANMAFSASVAATVRFDEELGPGQLGMSDDTLFDYHVRAAGFRVALADEAVAVHHFEPDRLEPQAILDLARKNGRSDAYVWRHWLHSEIGWLPLRVADAWLRWFSARAWRWQDGAISERRYDAAYRIEFFQRLRWERQRAARYPDLPSRQASLRRGGILRAGEVHPERSSNPIVENAGAEEP